MKSVLLVLGVVVSIITAAQDVAPIGIPTYNDDYSKYVEKLESGQLNINYRDFRESFIESQQFADAYKQKPTMDSLKRALGEAIHYKNYSQVMIITHQMLTIDYTNIQAHKVLEETYRVTGDTMRWKMHRFIELSLLKSILTSGDGNSCETAWHIIQADEETYVLETRGAKLLNENTDTSGGNSCNKVDTQTKQGPRTFYFDTSKITEGYQKLGLQ